MSGQSRDRHVLRVEAGDETSASLRKLVLRNSVRAHRERSSLRARDKVGKLEQLRRSPLERLAALARATRLFAERRPPRVVREQIVVAVDKRLLCIAELVPSGNASVWSRMQ